MAVHIRGPADHAASPGGWEVFVFGAAVCARLVAAVLDRASASEGSTAPRWDAAYNRDLSLGLLPSAVVVALHQHSGTACLIRDGCGYIPLYYNSNEGLVYFSTNLGVVRSEAPATGINTDKIGELLLYGSHFGRRTLWQGANVIIPGGLVTFSGGGFSHHRFWTPTSLFEEGERRRLEGQSLEATLDEVQEIVDEALAPLGNEPRLAVPCGGGVDSSFLGAYLMRRTSATTFWCVNQPDALLSEEQWMGPLSRQIGIDCKYVNLCRKNFLVGLLDALWTSQLPVRPNGVGGRIMRPLALQDGEQCFVMGAECDKIFGGHGFFDDLAPSRRFLATLAGMTGRLRQRLVRSLADRVTWLNASSQVGTMGQQARIACGHLERAGILVEAGEFRYPGQSEAQRRADMLTWSRFQTASTHNEFYERDELYGGVSHYPFAHPRMIRLAMHLPYSLKYRRGHRKWLWRTFASRYVGHEVAFRRKNAFPTLTNQWLDRADRLLPDGFLEEFLGAPVDALYARMTEHDPSRWNLINLELWGRLHVRRESRDSLLGQLS